MTNVSVIVPTYNGAKRLPLLLKSLSKQTFTNYELIIVIDGSTDETNKFLGQYNKFCSLKIINQTNKGRSGARNAGVKSADGNILIFMDDDVRFSEETIGKHVYHHKNQSESILVGSIIEEEQMCKMDIQRYRRELSIKWQNELGTVKKKLNQPYISAANFSIHKSIFERLNGFDEHLTDCEDHDLAVKAQEHGISIYFDPEIIGWHDDLITAQKYLVRLKEYSNAYNYLSSLRGWENKPHRRNFFINTAYRILSFPFWIRCIDSEKFVWLPESIRYKLYDAIFFSQSRVFI